MSEPAFRTERERLLYRLNDLSDDELAMLLDLAEPELPPDRGIDEDLAIASLANDERFHALIRRIHRNRDNWALKFAHGALASNNLVDQREVDYKRGYFGGALFYVERLPRKLAKAAALAAQTKESE